MIEFPPDSNELNSEFDERKFYLRTPIAEFFSNFYEYENLYVVRDAGDAQRQLDALAPQAQHITEAFKTARGTDIRADTPIQLRLELTIRANLKTPLQSVPDNAELTGTFQSFNLFGLMPYMINRQLPKTTWTGLKQLVSEARNVSALWLDCLEKDIINVADQRWPSGIEVTFPSGDKMYRPILSRHIVYESGDHTFEILFIETIPRKFLGYRTTSSLLAAIVTASRFRFAYFEEKNHFNTKFGNEVSDHEFETNYRQLLYDIERIEHEAMEFGVVNQQIFIQSFGQDKKALAERFVQTWNEEKNDILAKMPARGEHFSKTKRAILKSSAEKFLRIMEQDNHQFLLIAVDLYRDEIHRQFHIGAEEQKK